MLHDIRSALGGGIARLRQIGRRLTLTPFERRVQEWLRAGNDRTLRLQYDLNENSLVFDLGGYVGQWTSDIFSMYQCQIHIFEPVPVFAHQIHERFKHNSHIYVHEYGLGPVTDTLGLHLSMDGTGAYGQSSELVSVQLVGIGDFMRAQHIQQIDLMKVNIEGSEYDLLEHMLATGIVTSVTDLQVQFHDFVPNAQRRMYAIQQQLSQTHSLTYQSEFVWENWHRHP